MQVARFVMALAVLSLLSNFLRADEPEALEQFARWRFAIGQADRVALKFRAVHLDQFGDPPPVTRRTMSGVCYRDGEFCAATLVPAPISAMEPRNACLDRPKSVIAFNPLSGFESFTVIDGPARLHFREDLSGKAQIQEMPWKPASALLAENTPPALWNSEWSFGSMFSPVNFLPFFWPAEIDVSKFEVNQSCDPTSGDISLVLQRKPIRNWLAYRPRHLAFDRLTAVFRPGTDIPFAIAYHHDHGMPQIVRYYVEELETGQQANIPQDAFQTVVQSQHVTMRNLNP